MDTERFCTLDFLLGQTDSAPLPLRQAIPSAPPALPRHISALTGKIEIKPDMTFREASERWLSSLVSRRDTTSDSYQQYVRALKLFFADMTLRDIRLDHLTAYQKARFAGAEPFIRYRRPQDAKARQVGDTIIPAKGVTPCPAKPKKVNQELGTLIRILKRTGLWTEQHSDLYQQLPEDIAEIPRALAPEEQHRWLEAAMSHPRWQVVFWYSLLAFDTCMSTNEIRSLRLQDINLPLRTVTVPVAGSKNKYRHRTILMGDQSAFSALECLIQRANKLGSCRPDHYLFPWRLSAGTWDDTRTTRLGVYDPTKSMGESGIKKAWEEVRQATGLTWFRQYDCRHTAITRLAEAGVALPFIMKRAGHVSKQMTEHYTHLAEGFMMQEMQRAHRVYAMRSGSGSNAHGYGYQTPPMPYNSPASAPHVSYGTNRNAWTNAGAFPVK